MDSAETYLRHLHDAGQGEDKAISLGLVALSLAALDHPRVDLAPYRDHLDKLATDARETMNMLRRGMNENEALARVLADTIATRHGYAGDNTTFDDPQNADLIRVIDRRRGLPVSLGILYLDVAHRLGMEAHGLNTPGHFLMSVGAGEQARILDPFNGGVVLNPEDVRPVPHQMPGEPADYEPVGRRDVLLRLLNNIRTRALAGKDMIRSLSIAERMVLIAPARAELWLDLSRANQDVGKMKGAIKAAETCVRLAGVENQAGREAAFAIQSLKRLVN